MSNRGTADAVRDALAINPDISVMDLVASLPDHNKNTVRTLASRYRSEGSSPKAAAEDIDRALIADHLAGKITAEQLSKALHLRKSIEALRQTFVEVMVRANNSATTLSTATTQEEFDAVQVERSAMITMLGGTFSSIPPVPQAPQTIN